jgi:predicted enzyme related to lactoylglutathione lyase
MRLLINIDVPDLAPAIAFYSAALGLKLERVLDDDVAELSGASSVICLLKNRPGSYPVGRLPVGRDYARHWTPVHIDFVVEDVERATAQALAAGAIRESECVEWRGSKCISFADPFGHGFCLIEFAGQDYEGDDA